MKKLFANRFLFQQVLLGLFYLFSSDVTAQIPKKDLPLEINGPLAGSITMKSAKIWVQIPAIRQTPTDQIQTFLEYEELSSNSKLSPQIKSTKTVILDAEKNHSIWDLNGLEPQTQYQYRVVAKKGTQVFRSKTYTFKTETLWQWRKDPPNIKVLASSCAYTNDAAEDRPGKPYGQGNAIFNSMANLKPDVTLWMGDNIYLRETDFDNPKAMASRYDKWRSVPELQTLMQTGSHLATWDDHDYGANDSNSSNPFKQISLDLFKQYWPNPSFGLLGLPGVFTQYKSSDVEFFMLDDRWYRDNEKLLDNSKQMLGPEQIRWLKNALLSSTATWKLIISGSQVLNLNNKYEGWHHFEKESNDFLQWLEIQKIPGIMMLSGDRHFSVLFKKERVNTYPLYELTCSPSTAGPYVLANKEAENNLAVVKDSLITQNNFCDLEFSGKRGDRQLLINIKDQFGKSLFTTSIAEKQLR
jgi:alkaline phosphatase D